MEEWKESLISAIKSGDSFSTVKIILERARLENGDFCKGLREIHSQLLSTEKDIFNLFLAFFATQTESIEEMAKKTSVLPPQNAQIILVSPNPSIDVFLSSGRVYPGGGGGILGTIFRRFEIPTIVCSFVSSSGSGAFYRELALKKGIETGYFTEIEGDCGFTIYLNSGEKISRIGPTIKAKEREAFYQNFKNILEKIDSRKPPLIIFAGAVCQTENGEAFRFYFDLLEMVREKNKNCKVWVDTAGEALFEVLKASPDYVKINLPEFLELIEILRREKVSIPFSDIETEDEELLATIAKGIVDYFKVPLFTVTMGLRGAFQVSKDINTAILVKPMVRARKRVYTIGLGNTLMAMQAVGEVANSEKLKSLEYAVAAASVSAYKPEANFIVEISEITPYLNQLVRRSFSVPVDLCLRLDLASIAREIKNKEREPVIVADMDDSLTVSNSKISFEMSQTLIEILKKKIHFAILTSSSYKAVENQVLSVLLPLIFEKNLHQLLNYLHIFATQGSQGYEFNPHTLKFEQRFMIKMSDILGSENVQKIEYILEKTIERFKLKAVAGELIENRESQITLMILGNKATLEEKIKYEKSGGKEHRKKIANFINRLFDKENINAIARPAGKSSIDITPLGIDKGLGIEKIGEILGVNTKNIIFFGDELWPNGIDEPAGQKAGVVINVGPTLRTHSFTGFFFQSSKMGPSGVLEELQTILKII